MAQKVAGFNSNGPVSDNSINPAAKWIPTSNQLWLENCNKEESWAPSVICWVQIMVGTSQPTAPAASITLIYSYYAISDAVFLLQFLFVILRASVLLRIYWLVRLLLLHAKNHSLLQCVL